ncbi:hypothetical protein ACFY0F_26610 [Streptomyces sp. NPDC001544]|uniref:effector-associated constant component EACC1 n=1 Tax=Streptomyces sp. NPDC001544 TaxID=3364584 RepID=UPI0036B82C61
MDIAIRVRDGAGDDVLAGLKAWLEDEPELRGRVRLVPTAPEPGAMGGAFDQLVVMLGSGGALALARSLPVWLRQRRSSVDITMSRPDGSIVEIRADQARDADALIREALRDHGAGSTED